MFGNIDTTILSTTQKMYCFEESRYWNAKYPAILNNETVANLTQLNELDTQLYNQLTTCNDGIVFPDFEPRYRPTTKIKTVISVGT